VPRHRLPARHRHGVDPQLRDELERLSREFFALPEQVKAEIAMSRAASRGAAGSRWVVS
jgi:isopenicillin N synthase-like dioxygenase